VDNTTITSRLTTSDHVPLGFADDMMTTTTYFRLGAGLTLTEKPLFAFRWFVHNFLMDYFCERTAGICRMTQMTGLLLTPVQGRGWTLTGKRLLHVDGSSH